MFLLVKSTSSVIGLESSEAVLATMYASIREQYNELELELSFEKPNVKVFKNLFLFINELNKVVTEDESNIKYAVNDYEHIGYNNEEDFSDTEIEEITLGREEEEESIEIQDFEEVEISDDEVIETLDFEALEESKETISIDLSQEIAIEEIKVKVKENLIEEPIIKEEVKVEREIIKEEIKVPKVPNTPGDRLMESIKEQQKNEGLLTLDDDKVNTLAYKEHLVNYMKLGFACNMLMKKANECNDTAERAKLFSFTEAVQKRTDEFEARFKEIGLTTGQIFTFRMEVLRDVRKYKDDSMKEICDYINRLYSESDILIENLK